MADDKAAKIATALEKKKKLFRKRFDRMDTSKDGKVDLKEFMRTLDEPEAKALVDDMDTDGDGQITFDEYWTDYVKMLDPEYRRERKIRKRFKEMDTSGDGKLTEEEICQVFRKLDPDNLDDLMTQQVIDSMKDDNKDGHYDVEEFMKAMKKYLDDNPHKYL